MTCDEAVKEVANELSTNRNGAYALAVRLCAENGGKPDQLMADAVELEKQGGAGQAGAPVLVDVDFPDAEELAAAMLEDAEQAGGLGPDTLVLVPIIATRMVEERNRFLQMLGKA